MRRFPVVRLLAVLLALWFALPAALAQPTMQIVDTVPPGLTITNLGQVTVSYTATAAAAGNTVQITFFRDDGNPTTIAPFDPQVTPTPFTAVLPLRTGVDRDLNTFNAVIQDLVQPVPPGLSNTFSILADDVGPEAPVITSPVFPATVFTDSLIIRGTVLNQGAGGPTLPETSGQVFVRLGGTLTAIGGGAITTASIFVAVADLSGFVTGTPTDIDIFAVDAAGNAGTTLTVQVTRLDAAAPTIVATLEPPGGTITRNPGVTVRGTITGQVSPLTVNIFVDGLLESQVTGLSSGQEFIHTLNLPNDGPHVISIQGVNGNDPPQVGLAQVLGTVTLDRVVPAPPSILEPRSSSGPLIIASGTIRIEGLTAERDTVTTDTFRPAVLIQGPPGVTFAPPVPLTPDNSTGRFSTIADISNLPDGDYVFDVIVRDEAGNLGPESTARIQIVVDRLPPQVDRIRVNGILAPSANPEIYVGLISVPIEVTFSEPIVTPPDLFTTQNGGARTPAGRSGVTTRVLTWNQGVIPGFDGPVLVEITGGTDRAGNGVNATFNRLFVVDSVPPNVVSVDPSDSTTVSSSPARIRVRFVDPPSPVQTFSGVDLLDSTISLFGPIGNSAAATVPGTQTPFDPFTLDFVPTRPLTVDGTYRVTIVPEDKVNNRGLSVTRTFILDTTPIVLSDANVIVNPPRGGCVNETTHPGTSRTPFVEVTVTDPQFNVALSRIQVRDFCRVPPEVPGRKQVVDRDTMRFVFDGPLATDGSQDGVYAIQIDVADVAGNVSPTFTTTYVYDTTEPSVDSTFPTSDSSINGPLRHVNATLRDPRRDFCRSAGGISKATSTLELELAEPNPNLNTQPAGTKIRGTLRFEAIAGVERILLEIVDTTGFPAGLRVDGRDDGRYRLTARAVDCATNRSPVTSATFVYDTQRPNLVVDALTEGGTLTGPDFTLTGRLQDNLRGSGIDKVTVTLEAVDAVGRVTTAPFFLDAPATLDPVPVEARDPVVEWIFVGDLRRVPKGTRARLRVRGFDKAGNFDERIFLVTAMADTIPPPQLSAPPSGFSTSAQILTFRWDAVAQAARYRVRIVTPNGDVVERTTVGPQTSLDVNLTALPDPEGRFTWAVASIDAVGGVGAFSPNRPFSVDRKRPSVIAIDIVDPSPEAVGSINEGLVRITLHFDEDMDATRAPVVQVQPQNRTIPPLAVRQLSYSGKLWQGEVTIPEAGPGIPDHNGLAEITVTRAFDPAGNENLGPQGGITVFEIDTGPFFRVAVFKNPVDEQDALIVVKGFKRDGGAVEDIVDPPTLLVRRAGEPDQHPTMFRVNQGTFRGAFRLLDASIAPVLLRVAGRDRQGNTSAREITLAVARPRLREPIRIQASGLSVEVPAGRLPETSSLVVVGKADALNPELPGGELELVETLAQVGPLGLAIPGGAVVRLPPGELPEGTATSGLGIYRRDKDRATWIAGLAGDGSAEGSLDALGPLMVCRDALAPRVGEPVAEWVDGVLRLAARVDEGGSGLDPARLAFVVGGLRVETLPGDEPGVLRAELRSGQVRGGESLSLEVSDRAGNLGRSVAALVPAPRFGFSEAVVVPNPARTMATVRYRLNQAAAEVTLDVYDASGRRVRRLGGSTGPGLQSLSWDLRDSRGRLVANGVYLATLIAGGSGGSVRENLKIAVLR